MIRAVLQPFTVQPLRPKNQGHSFIRPTELLGLKKVKLGAGLSVSVEKRKEKE